MKINYEFLDIDEAETAFYVYKNFKNSNWPKFKIDHVTIDVDDSKDITLWLGLIKE